MIPLTEAWRSKIAGLLAQCVALTVSTASPNGSPRAADVYFCSDANLNLYFYSDPASRHSRNIARDPRVAAAVRVESMDWHEIKGMQFEGEAARVNDPDERTKAWRLICEKFPFYESFTDVVARLEIYRITPKWVRWLDNSTSFGYKEDLFLGER
jgi:uncharacterized protein YhbP (UPF0306 family)